jgi:hypothetical protein
MDDGAQATTAADVIGGLDAAVSGATYSPTGARGGSFNFGGSGAHLRVADDARLQFAVNQGFSFSLWVRYEGPNGVGGVDQAIFRSADGAVKYKLDRRTGGALKWSIDPDTGGRGECNGFSDLADGQFNHVVVTRRGSDGLMLLFVDGVVGGTTDNETGAVSATEDLFIGSRHGPTEEFIGAIDDLRLYDHALSVAEVSWLYGDGPG